MKSNQEQMTLKQQIFQHQYHLDAPLESQLPGKGEGIDVCNLITEPWKRYTMTICCLTLNKNTNSLISHFKLIQKTEISDSFLKKQKLLKLYSAY